MDDVTLKIDSGALLDVPCYEWDDCGKNWLAIIEGRDKKARGGLRRTFCDRANPPFYYFTAKLRPFQVIEFGADRVNTKRRTKLPTRVYGIILEVTNKELRYSPQPNALTALAVASTPAMNPQMGTARPVRRFRAEASE